MEKKILIIIRSFFIFALYILLSFNVKAQITINDDIANLSEDDSISIDVLNNDYGLSEGDISLSIVTEPEYGGKVTIQDDNNILYVPEKSFYGTDEFVYQVCNSEGSCGQGTVSIVVNNVDFTPILLNDTFTYVHNNEYIYDILGNDTLKDYPIVVEILQDFNHGNSYLDADNNLIPYFNPEFVGKDSLEYIVYDNDDDSDEAWVIVTVQYEGDNIYIPNSFTPNGDGYNDYFVVPSFSDYQNVQLKVFNEWGQVVYQSIDYQNDWDGEANSGAMNGKQVNEGTYYYLFKLSGGSEITGYVYIMR